MVRFPTHVCIEIHVLLRYVRTQAAFANGTFLPCSQFQSPYLISPSLPLSLFLSRFSSLFPFLYLLFQHRYHDTKSHYILCASVLSYDSPTLIPTPTRSAPRAPPRVLNAIVDSDKNARSRRALARTDQRGDCNLAALVRANPPRVPSTPPFPSRARALSRSVTKKQR